MPKIKMPKSSPSIDMTPMVDLAFLLVTFFMLAASFRSSEPVQVTTPTSVSDKIIPANILMVTIDKGGRVFFNMTNAEARRELLDNMSGKYKVGFTDKHREEFGFMESFGCSMRELPGYIDLSSEERGRARTLGIPYDSTNNELKDWIYFGNIAALNTGKTLFEEAKKKGDNPNVNDFKPKFILRVDSKTLYVQAQAVIDVFRDLNLNNLNFVTSMEMPPKK
jgi:biopolymer transport protein ExbD